MIPEYHIDSQTGIPQEIIYKITQPFDKFLSDIKNKLGEEKFAKYKFDEDSYQGYSHAMVVYKDNIKYYISPGNMLHYDNFRHHILSEQELSEYITIINKYEYLCDFKKENKELYDFLSKNGFTYLWANINKKKDKVYYSEEYLRNLLKQYKREGKSRSMFVMDHGSEHAFMRRHNLIHLYYECGLTITFDMPQGIYACEFNLPDGKYAYIGLTYNFRERERDHRTGDTDSSVYKFIRKHNLDPEKDMTFRIIMTQEECTNPSQSEYDVWEMYRNDGWKMLNRAPTGGRGQMPRISYTKEEIIKMIKDNDIKTVTQLSRYNHTAYKIAKKAGYLYDIVEKKICRHFTKDEIIQLIKDNNIKTAAQLRRFNNSAYNAAKNNNYLYEIFLRYKNTTILYQEHPLF